MCYLHVPVTLKKGNLTFKKLKFRYVSMRLLNNKLTKNVEQHDTGHRALQVKQINLRHKRKEGHFM